MKSKVIFAILTIILLSAILVGRNTLGSLMRGQVHFPEKNIGQVLKMQDGQEYTIFRWLKVDGKNINPDDQTVFKVRFRFKNLSSAANKRLSIIPAPFLIGMEGFREKTWTINEKTNEFQGIYQWSTKKAAARYPESFIFRLMTKRAAPGTVSYEIIPDTDLSDYIAAKQVH